MSLCNSSVYRWEKGGRALLTPYALLSFYLSTFIPSFIQQILLERGSMPHFIQCLCSTVTFSPSMTAPLYCPESLSSCFLSTPWHCTLSMIVCWPAPGARTLPVWGLALEWLCWEGTVPGMALPSVFSVTCINWMLSLLGLASASCYFSHIICLSLMFFSMFWEIFFSF